MLNNDWRYTTNKGREGADGVLGNKNGQMLMEFEEPVQFLINIYSETQVALYRIIRCCHQNFQKLTIELNHFFVINMMLGNCCIL